ncbi:MAG: hypothetical protein HOW73_46960 [Polyangiaceae bacterium]|nr:hypothetical protein [Polyangiaceae bacterium]
MTDASSIQRHPPPKSAAAALVLAGEHHDVTQKYGAYRRAGFADVDGDGRSELVVSDDKTLRVVGTDGRELARREAPGGIQLLGTADLDGDKREEILAGWGATLDRRDAKARVAAYKLEGGNLAEEIIDQPATDRQEVVAILPRANDLFVAAFTSKFMVRASSATRGSNGWALEEIASMRMATSYARADVDGDGQPDLVVGRVYGDDQDADGDAFVLRPDGTRLPIPTSRGLKSLVAADLDGDGVAELLYGDGWHKSYGKLARALLTVARYEGGAFHAELIDETPEQYAIEQIVVADLDGDAQPEIVARGNQLVRAYRKQKDRWVGVTIAGKSHDVAAGDLDGRPGAEVLIAGADGVIQVSLRPDVWRR